MSTWTHVAAVIRFDACRGMPGIENSPPDLGRMWVYNPGESVEERVRKHGECDIPCGSDESLQYRVWEDPDPVSVAAYTAMIWGDLRDYDNIGEILKYLKRVAAGRDVRQGCATIRVSSGRSMVLNWRMDFEAWEIVADKEAKP